MVSIEEARSQVETARQIVSDKRAQVSQLQNQLEEQERALPSESSQMALRDKFSGQQGIVKRKLIAAQRGMIQENLGYVKGYGESLTGYEGQISSTEQRINEYERKRSELLRDAREEAKAELEAYQKDWEAENPGEKLIIDWTKLRVKGVESNAFLMSMPLNEYNKKVEEINSQIKEVSSGNTLSKLNLELPRGEKIKIQSEPVNYDLIPMASAKEEGYVDEKGVYHGVWKKEPEPKGILEKLQSYQKKQENQKKQETTNIGVVKQGLAGTGSSFVGTASALIHPIKTVKSVEKGVSFIGKRLYSGENFPEISQKLSSPLSPYDIGYIGAEVLSFKGFGLLSKGITKSIYKAKDLPKINTVFTSQEIVKVGNDVWLRTGAVSDVKGLIRKNRIISASYTQVKQLEPIGEITPYKSATIGVLRKKTLNKGWSKPSGFGAGSVGIIKDEILTRNLGKIYGAKITQEILVKHFQSLGFVKTSKKLPKQYNAFVGISKEVNDANVILGLAKPLIVKKKKISFGYGQNRIFGITTKQKEPILSVRGNAAKAAKNIQTYGKHSNNIIATAEQKLAINEAVKDIFTKQTPKSGIKTLNLFHNKPKSDYSVKTKVETVQSVEPKIKQSIWYGTGQYERTSDYSASASLSKVSQKTLNRQKQDLLTGFNDNMGLRNVQLTTNAFKTALKLKSGQTTKQQTVQSFDWFYEGLNGKPKVGIPFKPSVSYRTNKGRILHSAPGQYLVIVKRFGQDNVVATADTLAEAKKLLTMNLRSTLAASGFITGKSGKKEDISNLFGSMFTRAKKDEFRLVQRRGKRLSSRSEVSEIFGFKKRKGGSRQKKIKWF